MDLKGVKWVHNDKIRQDGLELGQKASKGVNWVHNDKNPWISVYVLMLSS